MRASTIVVLGLATLGIASPYKDDMGDNHGHEVDECDGSGSGHGGEYDGYHGSGGENHGNGQDEHGSDEDGSDEDGSDEHGSDEDDHGSDEHGNGEDAHGSDDHGNGSDDHGSGSDHHDSDKTHRDNSHGCINRAEANRLAQAYAALIGAFKESDAHHWLSDSFLDYSDSINTFTNKPLGSATFDKTSFIKAQGSGANPPTPVTVVGEPVVECRRVAILWSSRFGKGWDARGLTIVEVEESGHGGGDYKEGEEGKSKWLMTRWDVEFNSLAWAYNMGQYFCLFGQGVGDASVCAAPKRRGLGWE